MILREDKYGFVGVSLRNENLEVAVVLANLKLANCKFATLQSETWKLIRFEVFINIVSKLTEPELEETGWKL